MQSTLNRSDWSCERIAHLNQALPVQIERDQCLSVEISQSVQTLMNLHLLLAAQDCVQRIAVARHRCLQDLVIYGHWLRAARYSIDRHSVNNLAQPSTECFRYLQLAQSTKRLNEHILAQLLCLIPISQSLVSNRQNVLLVPAVKLFLSAAIPALSLDNQVHNAVEAQIFVGIASGSC